jgi:C4-type Zn-finger protein
MAILDVEKTRKICPKCNSDNLTVGYKRLDSSKSSIIAKKSIKCNNCGYEK